MRGEHRGLRERGGLHRMGRVAHVEYGDADRGAGRVDRVGREQQGGVVERAYVALDVDVAKHLEATRGALVRDLGEVAPQAVITRAGGDTTVDARLWARAGAARRHGRGGQRWLGAVGDRRLGRRLPEARTELAQIVTATAEAGDAHRARGRQRAENGHRHDHKRAEEPHAPPASTSQHRLAPPRPGPGLDATTARRHGRRRAVARLPGPRRPRRRRKVAG